MFRASTAPPSSHDPAAVTLLLNDIPFDDFNRDAIPPAAEDMSEDEYGTANFRRVPAWRRTLFILETWLRQRRWVLKVNQGMCCSRDGNRGKVTGLRWCGILILGLLSILGVFQLLVLVKSFVSVFVPRHFHEVVQSWGQTGRDGQGLTSWPTDFTRDIRPIRCHSHNDYWRQVPLYSAICAGCISVEADVWLVDRELYVGHTTSSLTRNSTLTALYIDPLMDILAKQNPTTEFHSMGNTSRNGIFDTDPSQSLTLLIDFKTEGPATWPYVMEAIEPLRSANYLSHWNGSCVLQGPVVVVGTGNAPFGHVISNTSNPHKDIFLDAPLDELRAEISNGNSSRPTDNPTAQIDRITYNSQNSYFASVAFGKAIGRLWRHGLSEKQLSLLRGQIRTAHTKGLKVRYWDLPNWPIGLRNHVWDVLITEGVDLLNVDDLEAASRWNWAKGSMSKFKP